MRITILGMGNMGRAFAARAIETGHQTTVWNRTPGRTAGLVASGAFEVDTSARAVAGADAVLVVLADDAAVLDVCLDDDGVFASLEPDAVFANISTVSPATARRLAELGPEGRVLDAPVMGSPQMIASGLGRFLIGGPTQAVTAIEPLWNDLGSGYTHCGPIGAGVTIKILANSLLITGVTSLAEVIATAREHAIPDEFLRTLLADSPVVSLASNLRLDSLLDATHPGWFSPALARKDLRLAIDLAEETGVGVRIGPAAEALLTTVIDAGGEWPDFAAVIEALS
ncbi:MAG TPA: NAD(P)-dependent oxidoreductase [Acidimicrobiales bacterium]|nr:NAD(P)-dependent oxidoreductase [Acidimicrobiales bacterium]